MKNKESLTVKVIIIAVLVVLISGGIMGAVGYILNRNAVVDAYGARALTMAQTIAANVDGESMQQTVAGGVKDEYWQEVKDYLSEVRTETRTLWVYTLYPSDTDTGVRIYADGDDYLGKLKEADDFQASLLITDYPENLAVTLKTGESTASDIYYGNPDNPALVGYAPIKDNMGRTVGVAGIEISVDDVLASVNMFGLFIIITLLILGAVLTVLSAHVAKTILIKPIAMLAEASKKLRQGNTDIALDIKSKDEIGVLASDFISVAGTVNRLVSSIETMTKAHETGNMGAAINVTEFEGTYSTVAAGINSMIGSYVGYMQKLSQELRKFGTDDLSKNPPSYNRNVLLDELSKIVKAISDKAVWYESIINAVPFPSFATDTSLNITFANKSIEKLFGVKLEDVIGKPCHTLKASICNTDNCSILNFKRGLPNTKFAQNGRQYMVAVAQINNQEGALSGYVEVITDTTEMDSTIENLNKLGANIKLVSEKVTDGVKQIAESSQRLADGATIQTASIEELNSSITTVNEKTQTNAENSENAKQLSRNAKKHAESGDERMSQMLTAMDGIKNASDNIAKIIQTIKDIAFQTNLLSLNAAVEAAHAGEFGRGFAVVAEEVSNLAARSQKAAQETNDLISESISRVQNGIEIATDTAASLKTIVNDFDTVSSLIDQVATASSEQAESIGMIGRGIAEISRVTQDSSASNQETAAASQALAGQADILREMVSKF